MIIYMTTTTGYVPPLGYKIAKIEKLADGTYRVTLEPFSAPKPILGMGSAPTLPYRQYCNLYRQDVVNGKGIGNL
jgi:hypothetical protein